MIIRLFANDSDDALATANAADGEQATVIAITTTDQSPYGPEQQTQWAVWAAVTDALHADVVRGAVERLAKT